jgi:hypothetical protein
VTPIQLLRSIGAQRDAAKTYGDRARWFAREARMLDRDGSEAAGPMWSHALLAERAASAELENPIDPAPKWCPCPACWRYLTRTEDWETME